MISTHRRLLAALFAALLVLAGCSAGGGSDAEGSSVAATDDARGSTTTTDGSATTDDIDGTDSTTTTGAGEGEEEDDDSPTAAELEALLPTTADLPAGFRDVTDEQDDDEDDEADDGDDDPMEQAMLDACPGLAAFAEDPTLFDDDEDATLASRTFEGTAGEEVEVKIETAEVLPPGGIDFIVDAFAECQPFTVEDDGVVITADFQVTEADLGDGGLRMIVKMSGLASFISFDVQMEGLMWMRGSLMGSVLTTSGLDQTTFESVEIESGLADRLAGLLDEGLADVTG